jgi:hypothetical protein
MRLQRRVARLERLWPAPPPPLPEDNLRKKRWASVAHRFVLLARQAGELMCDAEREQVRLAVKQLMDNFGGPFAAWVRHLQDGWCRLPELQPAVMKELLLTWLRPEVDGGMVCSQCGLEYPKHKYPPTSEWKLLPGKKPREGPPPWYDLPQFFSACPNCGASSYDIDWPHLIRECCRPWMELDGFAGREEAPGEGTR